MIIFKAESFKLFLLCVLLISSTEATNCMRARFPIFFGSSGAEANTKSLAYHAATKSLVMAGGSNDPALKHNDGSTIRKPLIVMYSGDNFSYIWGKVFIGAASATFQFNDV